MVTTEKEFIGKRVRKYYTLTKTGSVVTTEKSSELSDFIATIAHILEPKPSM